MHTLDASPSVTLPRTLDAATLAALSALTLWAVRELSLACDSYTRAEGGECPAWRTPVRARLAASVALARRAREAWVAAPASAEAVESFRVALAALSTHGLAAVSELLGAEHPDDELPVPPRVCAAALCADAACRALGARRATLAAALTLRALCAVEAWGRAPVSPSTRAHLAARAIEVSAAVVSVALAASVAPSAGGLRGVWSTRLDSRRPRLAAVG